jgi:limonene 1,2-monooxygenase
LHTRIGAFLSTFHEPGQDPHLAIQRELDLVETLDRLNYDEAWFGEHQSHGWALVGAPETLIAAAAQRTRQIKLANGVVPLPMHHPFHVSARAVHLDHLTRGRYILGVGPGVPFDAAIFGVDRVAVRTRFDEALPVVLDLVNGEKRVSEKTGWFELHDAQLQLPRYSPAGIEVAVGTNGFTNTSPVLAGRHGLSLVSFAQFFVPLPPGITQIDLAQQWQYAEESAEEHGRTIDRRDWRVVLPVHVAATRKEAFDEVREGFDRWVFEYFGGAVGHNVGEAGTSRSRVLEEQVEAGSILVGSVDDVVDGFKALQERSGGFGTLLVYVSDWASWAATDRSMELLARYVAPYFTGTTDRPREAAGHVVAARARS